MSSAGLIAEQAAMNVTSMAISEYDKVRRITSAVMSHITNQASPEVVTQRFDKFVLVLYDQLKLDDLATKLAEKLCESHANTVRQQKTENKTWLVPYLSVYCLSEILNRKPLTEHAQCIISAQNKPLSQYFCTLQDLGKRQCISWPSTVLSRYAKTIFGWGATQGGPTTLVAYC